jgi:hypothetical protein
MTTLGVTNGVGDRSLSVFASDFDFAGTAALDPETEVNNVEVYIKSWASADRKIKTDVLRLIRPFRNGSGSRAPLLPSRNCIGHCRPWLTLATAPCQAYTSFNGTPEQWGFPGTRLRPEEPENANKTWLKIRDIRQADFGVVFRCKNISQDAGQECRVDSIEVVVNWTDANQRPQRDRSFAGRVRHSR